MVADEITRQRLNLDEGPFIGLVFGLQRLAETYGLSRRLLYRMNRGLVFSHSDPPSLLLRWIDHSLRHAPKLRLDPVALRREIVRQIEAIEQSVSGDPRALDSLIHARIPNVAPHWLLQLFDDPPDRLIQVLDLRQLNQELMRRLKGNPDALRQLRPRVFEELIAELLASFGWKTRLTAQTRDGGYDVFAIHRDGDSGVESTWLVECKRWSPDRKVGIEVVRSLRSVKMELSAGGMMIATTSNFTSGVIKWKDSHYDLELVDIERVVSWVAKYRPRPAGSLYMKQGSLVLPGNGTTS